MLNKQSHTQTHTYTHIVHIQYILYISFHSPVIFVMTTQVDNYEHPTQFVITLMKGDRLWCIVMAAEDCFFNAGQITQAVIKPKIIRKLNAALKLTWEDLPQEPINKVTKNFTKGHRRSVVTDGGHIENML